MGALSVYSKFYYGIRTTAQEYLLNFDEGGSELTAALNVGSYSPDQLRAELERALNEAGALTYSVTLNRSTRVLTIAASGTFTLLGATGSSIGNGVWGIIGFPNADVTGTTLSGNAGIGLVYSPQFILQSYLPKENNRRALSAVVNKSASGKSVSVQSFGEERFIKFNIQYVTDTPQPSGQRIRNNPNAVQELIDFLTDVTGKGPFEFMPDESNVDDFTKVILESTRDSKDGTSFELTEYYDRNLPNFFESGPLVLRVIE